MTKINCILLIDDNPADNFYHKLKIKEAGVCDNIQVATTALAGLVYIKSALNSKQVCKPDLIYLDINLPGMDGFGFLTEYQKLDDSVKSTAVIIMLTTSLNPDDKKRAFSYKEVTAFQNKPLTIETIKEAAEAYF